jgi:hypothetical protein
MFCVQLTVLPFACAPQARNTFALVRQSGEGEVPQLQQFAFVPQLVRHALALPEPLHPYMPGHWMGGPLHCHSPSHESPRPQPVG